MSRYNFDFFNGLLAVPARGNHFAPRSLLKTMAGKLAHPAHSQHFLCNSQILIRKLPRYFALAKL
jgi:hypothetical protein